MYCTILLYDFRVKPSESLFNQVLTYQPHYAVQHAYCTCSNGRVDCTKGSKNLHKRVGCHNFRFTRDLGLESIHVYLFTVFEDDRTFIAPPPSPRDSNYFPTASPLNASAVEGDNELANVLIISKYVLFHFIEDNFICRQCRFSWKMVTNSSILKISDLFKSDVLKKIKCYTDLLGHVQVNIIYLFTCYEDESKFIFPRDSNYSPRRNLKYM